MKSVYSAVRTGSLNKAICASSVKGQLQLNMYRPVVTICTTSLTFNNCTFCPHCIYAFCIYLRTNSDLCHLQHKLIGFYNPDEKCLQRGTDWGFKYSGLHFGFKGLNNGFIVMGRPLWISQLSVTIRSHYLKPICYIT